MVGPPGSWLARGQWKERGYEPLQSEEEHLNERESLYATFVDAGVNPGMALLFAVANYPEAGDQLPRQPMIPRDLIRDLTADTLAGNMKIDDLFIEIYGMTVDEFGDL